MPEIKITCTGAGAEDYRELIDLQGNLKERTDGDIENVLKSITVHGFSFPFFAWKSPDGNKYVFDGHGRKIALAILEERGYEIPLLPTSYIFADNIQEAKTKLLLLNARYGSLTEAAYNVFTSDMNTVDLEGVSIKFDIPQKIKVDTADYTENREAINDFSDVEINILCPHCIEESTFTIKELLELMGE